MTHILVADDEKKMRHILSLMLERRGYSVDQAENGEEALEKIITFNYDLVISDIKMPKIDGIGMLNKVNELGLTCPFVFITAYATVESAVDAMQRGADDYITKPFEEDRILMTIERSLRLAKIVTENKELKAELKRISGDKEIVYVSKEMSTVMQLATRVARSDSAVMITGESGTGKELIARYIHKQSGRNKGKFVPINCAAISPSLVESELFGYEKGAFTGADRRTKGKFEYASAGTLFLDEIGDLPMAAQAKLLRALQEKKIQRVGGHEEIDIDVRVVCATNQDLENMVERGKFREDLFFRVNVLPIVPPPLRNRKDDIIPLAHKFLKRVSNNHNIQLTSGAERVLKDYHWPGNVRELLNAMERASILSEEKGIIPAEALSFLNLTAPVFSKENGFQLPEEGISLEALQQDMVRQAMTAAGGNQTTAAKMLGLTRAKFRVLLKQL